MSVISKWRHRRRNPHMYFNLDLDTFYWKYDKGLLPELFRWVAYHEHDWSWTGEANRSYTAGEYRCDRCGKTTWYEGPGRPSDQSFRLRDCWKRWLR